MSHTFWTAVKTLDRCISIAGEDVLSFYGKKNEDLAWAQMEQETLESICVSFQ